ncbi:unnamed protein product [Laminaria digitata]
MAPSPEKQAGKLLGLLEEEGREYGDLVAERLVELVRSEPLESRDSLHRQLVTGAAPYLSHTAWYARVAAASCLESLARLEFGVAETAASEQAGGSSVTNTAERPAGGRGTLSAPQPQSKKASNSGGGDALTDELAKGWVGLGDVRLPEVLERGALLLSRGEEDGGVGRERAPPSADVGVRVDRQRKRLLRCLGLAGGSGEARAGSLYSSIADAIEDEDLQGPAKTHMSGNTGSAGVTAAETPDPVATDAAAASAGVSAAGSAQLSSRQRNRLKREARAGAAASAGAPPFAAKAKRRRGGGGEDGKDAGGNGGGDSGGGSGGGGGGGGGVASEREDGPPAFLGRARGMMDVAGDARGALVSLAADLVAQLFYPVWQCRHGAALGALSILRAWNARRRRGESVPYGDRMAAWAEDAVARCVCVLALDRFGDYSGRMVAPVRETAAQLLAVAALQLDGDRLQQAGELLLELTTADEWQARHGGYCGLESLCAVAVRGDGGGGGGTGGGKGDVRAAAARAVRLVMRRYLLQEAYANGGGSETLVHAVQRRGEGVGGKGSGSGAGSGRGGSGGGGSGSGGIDGGEVFDLVWEALEGLDQDSACVEDLADLLETCCEDVGQGCGSTDPLSGECRLKRLLELWQDGRARVRACAVRSLLALTTGMVGATCEAAKVQSATAAGSAKRETTATRCEVLLKRCFGALLDEGDDSVREHCARLWTELLKGLIRTDDHGVLRVALANACLRVFFTPVSPLSVALEAPAAAAAAAGAAVTAGTGPAPPPPSSKTDRARKRARGDTAPTLANASAASADADVDAAAVPPSPEQQQQQQHGEVQAWQGRGASATFSARLAAAEALSELVRAGAESAPRGAAAAAAVAVTAPGGKGTGGSRRRRTSRSSGEAGASVKRDAGGNKVALLAHKVVVSEAARRAGSGWAWERELAFLLMEACAGGKAGSGGGSASASVNEVVGEAEKAALVAIDNVLAPPKDDASEKKVFNELEGVDKAVTTACSGVIRALLQVCLWWFARPTHCHHHRLSPASCACHGGQATEPAAAATTATGGEVSRGDRALPRGAQQKAKRTRTTTKAAAAAAAAARRASASMSVTTTTHVPHGAASVERTFQALAAAFGETLMPLDRSATRQEREVVWTGRTRHFHGRIQAQQAVLMKRIAAAAASTFAVTRPLLSELNPILRPLVSGVKKEPDAQRRQRSAHRLAHLAADLLSDAARPERQDAGAMVLSGLAALAGKQSSGAAGPLSDEASSAAAVARSGATETLRHAVVLAPRGITRALALETSSSSAVDTLAGSDCGGSGCSDGPGEEDGFPEYNRDGRRDTLAMRAEAMGEWLHQTLTPLTRCATATNVGDRKKPFAGSAAATALAAPAAPTRARKLSASERKLSPADLSTNEVSAALGLANALVQAARNPVSGGEAGPLEGLLLETTLAAGLVALARSVSPGTESAENSLAQSQQQSDHGRCPPFVVEDGGGAAASTAEADAAMFIVREAAALYPEGVWLGLRAELLPALAAGSSSVGGGGGSGEDSGGGGGGSGGGSVCVSAARGVRAGLVLKEVVDGMGKGVVPFATRLLPVALRGMTDTNEEVRRLLAGTFNRLVKAVALAEDGEGGGGHGEGEGNNAGGTVEGDGELIARHLVRGEPLPRLHRGILPGGLAQQAAVGVTLRPYQWEGIAWLDFLRRIGAHGILADDMGLGKTLQALMAVAMCHHHNPGRRSLVVCPSTLVHHWQAECSRYFGQDLLRAVAYAGSASTRRRLAAQLGLATGNVTSSGSTSAGASGGQPGKAVAPECGSGVAEVGREDAGTEDAAVECANVVVTSYNVLRTDAGVLGGQAWLYLVLDEAHLLSNPTTRTARAARALKAKHRVGLTGTPIQNSVLELWSLFQFLMPGYLGDRRSFQRDVAKPVRAALSSDGDGRATAEGLKELEKLHKQVLPFVLRREKTEVLADLPPKIITEIVCDLTPEQRRLHKTWERGGDGGRALAAVAEAESAETARVQAAVGQTMVNDATETKTTPAASASPAADGPAVDAAAVDAAAADAAADGVTEKKQEVAIRVAAAAKATSRVSVGAQALRCLSKLQLLCVHPALVAAERELKGREASRDVRLSGKLMALRELLWNAGIGKRRSTIFGGDLASDGSSSSSSSSSGDCDADSDGSMDDSDLTEEDDEGAQEEKQEGDKEGKGTGGYNRRMQGARSTQRSRERERNSDDERAGEPKACPGATTAGSSATLTETEQAVPANSSPCSQDTTVAARLPRCKCLVFAQHKAALDVTETALLRPCFPEVKYLRMDGSSSQAERAAVVDRFSTDQSVAILLLTTRVGHLGLNLSAASMVVFLEHDWNPQVDLQAMDRAHRLGQRNAVNVYRLIAASSIEQRVLRLQGHKLDVAGAVVSRENALAFSNGTGDLLGMLGEAMVGAAASGDGANGRAGGATGAGDNRLELWSTDEDYAYLASDRLADSVARE